MVSAPPHRTAIAPIAAIFVALACAACEEPQPVAPTRDVTTKIVPIGTTSDAPEHAVVIALSRTGAMSFDGAPIPDDGALRERVRRAIAENGETRFVVAHDRETPYARVTHVLDAVRQAGSRRLATAQLTRTEPPAPARDPAPPPPPASAIAATPPTPPPPRLGTPAEIGNETWSCMFPDSIDRSRIESASVTMKVLVDVDGKPVDMEIVGDATRPFAEAARSCALKHRGWVPAKDPAGQVIRGWTSPFKVQFAR